MGGCCSEPEHAVVDFSELPVPKHGEAHHFYFVPRGRFSRFSAGHFKVLQGKGDQKGDPTEYPHWFDLIKIGGFGKPFEYLLYDLDKTEGAEHGKLVLKATGSWGEYQEYSVKAQHTDSDDSLFEFMAGDSDDNETTLKRKSKFKLKVSIEFRDSQNSLVATLKIKAKGKASRTDVTEDRPDGPSVTIPGPTVKKLKKLFYHLTLLQSDGSHKEVPIEIKGGRAAWQSQQQQQLEWKSDMFDAEADHMGVFKADASDILTHLGDWDPCLAGLVGFTVTNLFSPADVLNGFNPRFPSF